ncbi:hypothetical protein ACJW30_10G155100 [Castanea mollissima]
MEVDEVKNSNNNQNNNNRKNKKKENSPSVPSNFVTIVQLEERWLREKRSKLKEMEQKEAAEKEKERQRKLQPQKLREREEEELKRKRVQSQGRLKFNTDGRKPDRRQPIWRENRRAVVEVSPAKKPEETAAVVAVEVGAGNVSARKEQTGEEAKENNNEKKNKKRKGTKKKKKMKPRSEEEKVKEKEEVEVEVTGGASHAPKVISEKENSPAKANGESEGKKSEFRPTAEIERKFGDFTIRKGNVRVTRPNTGIYHGHRENRGFGRSYRDYRGSSKFGAGMVWVKKGEIGGVHNHSSITEPKKSM